MIVPAGEEVEKKGQNRSKNTSERETNESEKMEEVEKRSQCLKLDINDRLEV